LFASNIRALLATNLVSPSVSKESISMYLSFRASIMSHTMFTDIKALLPGHYLRVCRNGDFSTHKYWDLPLTSATPTVAMNEDYVRSLLEHSVYDRMNADVPVCSYLSGGVDSSGVTALMHKIRNVSLEQVSINTYTIGLAELNEFEYANIVASKYNTKHRSLLINCGDYFRNMVNILLEKGEPLGVPNEVPLYLMSKALKDDGFTVVLSGEGADEVFHGYGRIFQLGHDYERVIKYTEGSKDYKHFFDAYKGSDISSFKSFFLSKYSYLSLQKKNEILLPSFVKDIENDSTTHSIFNDVFDSCKHLAYQDQVSYAMIKLHLPILLRRCDNSTMLASVEGRVPFVDHKLVESAFNIPSEEKIRWVSEDARQKSDKLLADDFSETHDIPKAI
jgi:asparagine synthase (glutamine-hydrolysing)